MEITLIENDIINQICLIMLSFSITGIAIILLFTFISRTIPYAHLISLRTLKITAQTQRAKEEIIELRKRIQQNERQIKNLLHDERE